MPMVPRKSAKEHQNVEATKDRLPYYVQGSRSTHPSQNARIRRQACLQVMGDTDAQDRWRMVEGREMCASF